MKKKIIVFSHWLELGGAERSLIGLLDAFDQTKYDVDLFLCRHTGELMQNIPEGIHLLPENPKAAVIAKPLRELVNNPQYWCILAARLFAKLASRIYRAFHKSAGEYSAEFNYVHKFVQFFLTPIQPEKDYDLAISFLAPHYIVANKIRARKKIAWIHTDYSVVKVNVRSELKMWSAFDRIVSISDNVSEAFCGVFPELKDRLILIENILPEKLIRDQVKEFSAEPEMPPISGGFRLLTIGRFSYAKRMDEIPAICKLLLSSGLDVKWYLVGYGGDEPLIRQRIAEAGMEDRVIILGKRENPYPYMVACDLYAQPSRYEGKCVAVREAQLLCKPVVITNYATSASQLEDGVDGVIVPMDIGECAEGIAKLLLDSERMKELAENCGERDYSNSKEVEKLYSYLQLED